MLRKGVTQKVQSSPNHFLSSIFVTPKKDTGNRPVKDKVKEVKQTYTIGALQNERSVSFEGLKEVLHKGD